MIKAEINKSLTIIKTVESQVDSTVKYIFKTVDELTLEFTYIDKKDGKQIICVPSQTMCNLGCTFCHLTKFKDEVKTRNVMQFEIYDGVNYIFKDKKLGQPMGDLLISYMGSGEPILNYNRVIESMIKIKSEFSKLKHVRFGLATSLPKDSYVKFIQFTRMVEREKLNVKLHLSLHYTNDHIRNNNMPLALNILDSIKFLELYSSLTGNGVEIHYVVLPGINDSKLDAIQLCDLIKGKMIPVKFLYFSEDEVEYDPRFDRLVMTRFRHYLDINNIEHESYTPPGSDIGAACGQFSMDEYIKQN